MKTNVARPPIRTHEGGIAKRINPEQQLRRSVMGCMLFEAEYYEDGETVADRIRKTIPLVCPAVVAAIAVEAREKMKLRHVPLLIVREMARLPAFKPFVAETLARVIQRADELAEFCAIWQKDDPKPLSKTLSAQAKKGLAKAFGKFSEYELAKWSRDGAVKLRDVLFLCHAKPKDADQDALWKRLIAGTLATPDTWECELSASKDKLASWTRLLTEKKLGALALLRNLRNMTEAKVPTSLVRTAISEMKAERVLPFRFIAASRVVPALEDAIEPAMLRCVSDQPKLPGKTVLLVDVSGSMEQPLSAKSDMKRIDAANGLAVLLREICEEVAIYSFSMKLCVIPPRRGFALRDAILNSQEHSGTPLGLAVKCIYADTNMRADACSVLTLSGDHTVLPASYQGQALRPDRLIVITDEQSADKVPDPFHGKGYMINVASQKNGVGYGPWIHIDGFSEAVVDFIRVLEGAPVPTADEPAAL